MAGQKFTTVDEYIKAFPRETQKVLEDVRHTIHKAIPEAEEVISYNIPCFKLRGKYVVYFSGYSSHVGLYPRPSDDKSLQNELEPYASGKGTLRFPLDKPIPYNLITKVTIALARNSEAES